MSVAGSMCGSGGSQQASGTSVICRVLWGRVTLRTLTVVKTECKNASLNGMMHLQTELLPESKFHGTVSIPICGLCKNLPSPFHDSQRVGVAPSLPPQSPWETNIREFTTLTQFYRVIFWRVRMRYSCAGRRRLTSVWKLWPQRHMSSSLGKESW